MTLQREVHAPRTFSFAQGPFLGALRRLHLVNKDGIPRTRMLVAIAWLPLCLGALARVVFGERPQPILFDLSVHVRLLAGIPIVVLAGRLLEIRCRGAIEHLFDLELADRPQLDLIVDRAERMRDSRVVTLAIAAIALLVGQSVLWGATGPTGVVAGVVHGGALSFARVWYSIVALPLLQFLLLRWLWHWAIWSYIVIHVSRLPLGTIAMHPDHAAGLGFLSAPISAFAMFTLGVSAILAGAWGTQILHGHATMQSFTSSFVVFVVVAALVACGPQLAYIGHLYTARHRELRQYHRFAIDYVRDFHGKWLVRPADDELGSQDIQALNDLGGSYGTLEKTRLVPVGPRMLVGVWVCALIPMLPLVCTAVPIADLAKHVGGAMLGGIPF